MNTGLITGAQLRDMIVLGSALLQEHKEEINALNVFPVPDGDTGTNMSLTMMTAVQDLAGLEKVTVSEVAQTVSKGALKGARGNSGVILSQILRGFAKGAAGLEEMDIPAFVSALAQSTEMAYKAVMRPREGTILTVARAISEEAETQKEETDFSAFFAALLKAGDVALQNTPEQLPVLKQAGVVDAGGQGLLTILQGIYSALDGESAAELLKNLAIQQKPVSSALPTTGAASEALADEEITFGFCSELFIENILSSVKEEDIDHLREEYASFGDCVLVVGDLELLKVHVHSNDPGRVLQTAQKLGEITNIKIDNMRRQHRSLIEEARGLQSTVRNPEPTKEFGVVAVSAGEGLNELWHELAVDEVIMGGQTMNPSAEDIVKAVRATQAKNVYVLPNNSNIILAANQAADLMTDRKVVVVPTKTIPQGIGAMVAYIPEDPVEDNLARMTEAAENVASGSVTYAVRDSSYDGNTIHKDDILGLVENKVAVVGRDVQTTTMDLVEKMLRDQTEMITLYSGEGVSQEEGEALCEALTEKYPDCDITLVQGGQPLYYYLISVEA